MIVIGAVLWPVLAAALAASAGQTQVVGDVRAEGRWTDAYGSQTGGGGEVTPRIGIEHRSPAALYGVAYTPRFVLEGGGSGLQALHRGTLSARLQPGPRTEWTATLFGSYGTNDLRLQQTDAGTGFSSEPLPAQAVIRHASASLSVGVRHELGQTLRSQGTLGFLVQGGTDDRSRAAFPVQRIPTAKAALEYQLAPRDTLTTSGDGSYSDFDTGQRLWAGRLLQSWKRALTPNASAQVGAGLGLHGAAGRTVLGPAAEAGYDQTAAPSLHLAITARAGPYVDSYAATSYGRAEAQGNVAWRVRPTVGVNGSASGAVAYGGPRKGEGIFAGQLAVDWITTRFPPLTLGVRDRLQRAAPDPAAPAGSGRAYVHEWMVFLATSLHSAYTFGRW